LLFCRALSDNRMGLQFSVQLLLGLARAVTLGPKSRRTHGHILLSHLWLTQPGGPGSRIYIPQEQGGQLHPRELCSLFVASYDSQGLRWRYSNQSPHVPPHRITWLALVLPNRNAYIRCMGEGLCSDQANWQWGIGVICGRWCIASISHLWQLFFSFTGQLTSSATLEVRYNKYMPAVKLTRGKIEHINKPRPFYEWSNTLLSA
jgi:hypothetical protein